MCVYVKCVIGKSLVQIAFSAVGAAVLMSRTSLLIGGISLASWNKLLGRSSQWIPIRGLLTFLSVRYGPDTLSLVS